MAAPFYRVLHGAFLLAGKEPDGDSVRFRADDPSLYAALHRAYRLRDGQDGSLQLRLEGIDAPECHYGRHAQPLGPLSRDTLLGWLGFADVRFFTATPTVVETARPAVVPGTILCQSADVNGRPVCYLLPGDEGRDLRDGAWIHVDDDLLARTLNARLLREGLVYPLVYTSTPFDHRRALRELAAAARAARRGVWEIDMTAQFKLEGQESIGPRGQLILPKLFRRCTDFLRDARDGFRGDLKDWLIAISRRRSRRENDRVVLNEVVEVHLSELIEQRNRWVSFSADLLALTFVEK
jgi:endonuclease YncB( thermonuclease family)